MQAATAGTFAPPPALVGDCLICGDEVTASNSVLLPCQHRWCLECLRRSYQLALESEQNFPVNCCDWDVPHDIVRRVAGEDWQQYLEREEEVNATSRVYCGNTLCNKFLPTRLHNTQNATAICPTCTTITCIKCKEKREAVAHECVTRPEDRLFQAFAEKEHWQHCPHCKRVIELKDACNHIICVCGQSFCYVCGEVWRGTHGCPNYGAPIYDWQGYNQDGFHRDTGLNRAGQSRQHYARHPPYGDYRVAPHLWNRLQTARQNMEPDPMQGNQLRTELDRLSRNRERRRIQQLRRGRDDPELQDINEQIQRAERLQEGQPLRRFDNFGRELFPGDPGYQIDPQGYAAVWAHHPGEADERLLRVMARVDATRERAREDQRIAAAREAEVTADLELRRANFRPAQDNLTRAPPRNQLIRRQFAPAPAAGDHTDPGRPHWERLQPGPGFAPHDDLHRARFGPAEEERGVYGGPRPHLEPFFPNQAVNRPPQYLDNAPLRPQDVAPNRTGIPSPDTVERMRIVMTPDAFRDWRSNAGLEAQAALGERTAALEEGFVPGLGAGFEMETGFEHLYSDAHTRPFTSRASRPPPVADPQPAGLSYGGIPPNRQPTPFEGEDSGNPPDRRPTPGYVPSFIRDAWAEGSGVRGGGRARGRGGRPGSHVPVVPVEGQRPNMPPDWEDRDAVALGRHTPPRPTLEERQAELRARAETVWLDIGAIYDAIAHDRPHAATGHDEPKPATEVRNPGSGRGRGRGALGDDGLGGRLPRAPTMFEALQANPGPGRGRGGFGGRVARAPTDRPTLEERQAALRANDINHPAIGPGLGSGLYRGTSHDRQDTSTGHDEPKPASEVRNPGRGRGGFSGRGRGARAGSPMPGLEDRQAALQAGGEAVRPGNNIAQFGLPPFEYPASLGDALRLSMPAHHHHHHHHHRGHMRQNARGQSLQSAMSSSMAGVSSPSHGGPSGSGPQASEAAHQTIEPTATEPTRAADSRVGSGVSRARARRLLPATGAQRPPTTPITSPDRPGTEGGTMSEDARARYNEVNARIQREQEQAWEEQQQARFRADMAARTLASEARLAAILAQADEQAGEGVEADGAQEGPNLLSDMPEGDEDDDEDMALEDALLRAIRGMPS